MYKIRTVGGPDLTLPAGPLDIKHADGLIVAGVDLTAVYAD